MNGNRKNSNKRMLVNRVALIKANSPDNVLNSSVHNKIAKGRFYCSLSVRDLLADCSRAYVDPSSVHYRQLLIRQIHDPVKRGFLEKFSFMIRRRCGCACALVNMVYICIMRDELQFSIYTI